MYTPALCKQTNNIYAVKKKRRDIYHKILIILDPFSLMLWKRKLLGPSY